MTITYLGENKFELKGGLGNKITVNYINGKIYLGESEVKSLKIIGADSLFNKVLGYMAYML